MPTYNGHKNYNHWNVSLWIHDDEGLYNLALECKALTTNLTKAAHKFITQVGTKRTPDGASWSVIAVKAALKDL